MNSVHVCDYYEPIHGRNTSISDTRAASNDLNGVSSLSPSCHIFESRRHKGHEAQRDKIT